MKNRKKLSKSKLPSLKKSPQMTKQRLKKMAQTGTSPKPNTSQSRPQKNFPVIGIGASAGGLEAISQLLTKLPIDTGMALIVVQHLDPSHESLSTEILSRTTQMSVQEIKDGTQVQPNHVYIIPPNHNLAILHGVLSLMPRPGTREPHMAVDYFFRSLAQDQKSKAIGIVLSGTGADGTQGLEAIKAEGGLAIAQDPLSAKYDGMPHSAIASGIVDITLTPEKIAEELIRFAHHPLLTHFGAKEKTGVPPLKLPIKVEGDSLTKIFAVLRNQSHVDFSHYKLTTIKRRIARRMVIHKTTKLEDYFLFLQSRPQEVRALFADLLINVTEFFRDPEVYSALKKQVLSKLIKNTATGKPIRIWVVGCATGEEAYSVAISLLELLGDDPPKTPIQIFATDISESAIQKARAGVYPESIQKNVSKERLNRFFERTDVGYKIAKFIREMCLFSRHDVTSDPPFSKLDLICCRNLLIYFDSTLQKHVLPILHYALNPDGFLWLGRAESVGSLSTFFRITDKTKKFYLRGASPTLPRAQFGSRTYLLETLETTLTKPARVSPELPDFQRDAELALISKYAPPGVLVNSNMEVIIIRGKIAPFLELLPGQASLNLFKMANIELVPDLRIAVQVSKKQNISVTKEDLSIHEGNQRRFVNITVIPLPTKSGTRERRFWILFEPATETLLDETTEIRDKRKQGKRLTWKAIAQRDRQIRELDRELTEVKGYQQSVAEDHEATQEEITSANEELQSTNEELQSTNEELETAKEELQSTNEELTTVNDELQNRNSDLTRISNDLVNLLGAVEFPIVMVGADGRIRRFTPAAGKLLNLLSTDIGRPVGDIRPGFDEPNLQTLVSEVMETITLKEREVRNHEGRSFRLQVRPYKTTDNRIDGAVISLIDITLLKNHLIESQSALKYATAVADTLPHPLGVLDEQLHLLAANPGLDRMFELVPGKVVGTDFMAILTREGWNVPRFRQLLTEVITDNHELKNFEIEYSFQKNVNRILLANAQIIKWQDPTMPRAMLLSLDDITERKTLERTLEHTLEQEKEARAEAERANKTKDIFLATLSHELRTPLTSILSWSQLLQRSQISPERLKHGLNTIEQSAYSQSQMINDLLDISRIQAGKLPLTLAEIEPSDVVRAAIETLRAMAEGKKISIKIFNGKKIGLIRGDSARLQQIIWNILTNSIKFSPEGSKVEVYINKIKEHGHSYVSIRIVDHGKGIDPAFLPHLFTRFSQQDSTSSRVHGGLGIGLALVRDLVKSHSGSVQAESPGPGQGATFTVLLPLVGDRELRAPQTNENTQTTLPSPPDLSGLKVLIVDDEPGSLEVFTEIVKSYGGMPTQCSSVRDAISAVQILQPNVIVSDIAMPLEDGYALIRKLRKLPPELGGRIPAMALTAYATQHDIEQAVAAGFQEHLSKPVDSEEFGRAIARLAKSSKSE